MTSLNFSEITYKYLKSCKIKVSFAFLEKRIKSHPEYPALLSFTDTLDELGLEYMAVRAEQEHIAEFRYPFLAGTPKAVSSFEIVTSLQYYENNKEKFLNRWDGVALMVNSSQSISNFEHKAFLNKEKKVLSIFKILAGIGLVGFLLCNALYFSPSLLVFSLLSIGGIAICSLIVLHGLGQRNAFTDQLCSTAKSQSCNLVLNSKAARFTSGIGMGDAGLMYFIVLFLFSLYGIVFQNANTVFVLLLIPCCLSIIFALFSVYYQWKVVKAWCRMCLIVIGIVLLQIIIPLIYILQSKLPTAVVFTPAILQFVNALFISSLWLLIKPLLELRLELKEKNIEVIKWKRNLEIFQTLLYKQTHVNTKLPSNPVIFGSIDAPLQFTIVSNPFCQPCAIAHQQLALLFRKYPDLLSISVIFFVRGESKKEDGRMIAIENILKATVAGENKEQILHDWFGDMDLEKFKAKYSGIMQNTDISLALLEYQEWTAKNYIPHTPLVYLNGHQIPQQYALHELGSFVVELSDALNQSHARNEKHESIAELSWE